MHALDLDVAAPPPAAMDAATSPLAAIWRSLEAEHWSCRSWRRHLAAIDAASESLRPGERLAWLAAMRRLWSGQGWALGEEAQRSLWNVAVRWCAWPLAAAVGDALSRQRALLPEETACLSNAHGRCGDLDRAFEVLIGGQLARPDATALNASYRALCSWADFRSRYGWTDGRDWNDGELLLEPLGHHHLPDFAWQYHDPAIAERCCLPAFESDGQWHRWLDAIYRCGDQWIGAVIHREWGFIGSVSLILHGGIGYFYYWFGPDFQGRGYGPRAVGLLLADAAERHGLHTCYAKVFDYNGPSRKALEKLGFEDIRVNAVAPDDNEMFYRRGPAADRRQIAEELHWLLAAMESNTRPAILLLPGD